MTRAVIACQAATCFSSLLLTRVSKSTSPALAIGSEIRVSLLRIAAWMDRAESGGPPPSLVTDPTRRRTARTWRHRHGVSWAAATMKTSTSRSEEHTAELQSLAYLL